MFLFGTDIDSRHSEFGTFNPCRPDEQVGRYMATAPFSLPHKIAAARAAQRDWADRAVSARIGIMQDWLDAVAVRTEDIARAITLEQGKPLSEARGETVKALAEARQMLMIASQPHGLVHATMRPGILPLSLRRPRGLIAAITPWNFPILTPLRKIVPALAFGNAIILKPSELAPAAAWLAAEAAQDILPDGLLQLVMGTGELGAALVASGAEGVTFTGSVATGKAVYRAAASTLAEISLELGGKNAALIHDVRDLDKCLDHVATSAFLCSGQRCTAISRIIVHHDLAEEVTRGLAARAQSLIPGDGMEPGTTLGPLISASHLEKVAGLVETGISAGARLRAGGEKLHRAGHFYAPTVLDQVDRENPVAREEIFGPVITVLSYDGLDEAFDILHDTEFGLSSALFSADDSVVSRFVAESRHGMIHVNDGTTPDSNMPFVGIRHSGVGACSVGPGAAAFYTTDHSVYLGRQ